MILRIFDGNLSLVGNTKLTECCIISSLIAATQGEVIIRDNVPGCSNVAEIQDNCEAVTALDPKKIRLRSNLFFVRTTAKLVPLVLSRSFAA